MIDASDGTVALELERLRGTVGTGLAEIKGQLDVIRTSGDRAREDIAAQASRADRLEARVAALERRIVFIFGASSAFGSVAGVAAALLSH